MKKYTLIILLFILFIAVAYFLFLRQENIPQAVQPISQNKLEKINIANIGEYSIFNIIAHEKGYFAKNGLEATVIEYPSGPPAVRALLAGKADVAIAADYVGVVNLFANQHLRIISQASKHKVFQVIARKDKGIQSPSDLRGKRIGVTRKSAGEYYLGLFLTFHNLSVKDVTIVDLPPAGIIEQLKSGQIYAAVIFDPHAYNLKKTMGDSVIEWSAHGDQSTFAVAYTTYTVADTHPDLIKRYISSLFDAEQYTNEHPAEAQMLVAKALRYDHDYVAYMWKNFIFAHGLEQELLFSMENQARWMVDNHLTDKTKIPNYLNYIYFDPLQQLKPRSITIIH